MKRRERETEVDSQLKGSTRKQRNDDDEHIQIKKFSITILFT